MPYNPLASLVGELIALPFVLVRGLFRFFFAFFDFCCSCSASSAGTGHFLAGQEQIARDVGRLRARRLPGFCGIWMPGSQPDARGSDRRLCLSLHRRWRGRVAWRSDRRCNGRFLAMHPHDGFMVVLIDAKAGGGVVWSVAVSTLGATQDGLQQGLWECWSIFFGR